MKNKANSQRITNMVQLSMLAALGVVLMMLVRFPIFPSAPFLEYDMGDVPVLIASLMFGALPGLLVLAIVSLIQALTVSAANGWVGFVMHFFSTGVFVVLLCLVAGREKKRSNKRLILGIAAGIAAMVAAMVPLNLIFTVHFLGTPMQAVKDMMLPIIIPFNLIKGLLSGTVSFLLFIPLSRLLKLRR